MYRGPGLTPREQTTSVEIALTDAVNHCLPSKQGYIVEVMPSAAIQVAIITVTTTLVYVLIGSLKSIVIGINFTN